MAISQQQRTELLTLLVGMFDAAPGSDILDELANGIDNGNTVAQYAANLVESSEFTGIYSRALTAEEFATSFISNLLGDTVTAETTAEAEAFVAGRLNAGASRDVVIIEALTALSAVAEDDATWGAAAAQLNNKVEVAEYFATQSSFTGLSLSQMQTVLNGVTSDDATVVAKKAAIDSGALDGVGASGQTFTLTSGTDTFVGTTGADTFVATYDATAADSTVTAFDSVDGSTGTDTLRLTTTDALTDGDLAALGFSVSNIENVVVSSTAAVAFDEDDMTGFTDLTVNATTGAVDVEVDTATTATVTKGAAVTLTDNNAAGKDKLATVNVSGSTGAVTVVSDALTSLSLTDANGGATVTAAAGSRDLTLGLNDVTAGTVADAEATSLTVNASGEETSGVTLNAAKATSLTINADEKLTLADINVAAAKSIVVTGDSLTTISAASTVTALTSVDSSASTGGVDLDAFALGNSVVFTGGAGDDAVQLGATTKAITTGAGDDRVLLSAGTTALGNGGSVDAGEGTADVIAFADADDATTASATSTFEGTVSNFEVVELAGAAGAGVTVDLANLDDISKVKLSADVAQTVAVNNLAAGGSIEFASAQTGVTTASVANAASGSADVLNVSLTGSAAATVAGLTVADVETLNISTSDTDKDTTDADITYTLTTLTAAAAKSVVVTGDAGLSLGTFTATTVTSFDASGMTTNESDAGVSWTTGALASAATITGSAGDDTFVFSAATKAVTVNAGAGDDTITGANAQANVINAGAGDDTVTMGSGNQTIDLGEGDDTLVVGTATTQTSTITLGAGTDTVDINAVQASAGAYLTITDMAAGDKIDVSGVVNGTVAGATLGSAITLGASSTFANYLDAVTAGAGDTNSVDGWFQLNGNTYLVIDNSAAATFQDGSDIVVELTGLVDLSDATQAAGVYTLV